jgi:hypothetical protein
MANQLNAVENSVNITDEIMLVRRCGVPRRKCTANSMLCEINGNRIITATAPAHAGSAPRKACVKDP